MSGERTENCKKDRALSSFNRECHSSRELYKTVKFNGKRGKGAGEEIAFITKDGYYGL